MSRIWVYGIEKGQGFSFYVRVVKRLCKVEVLIRKNSFVFVLSHLKNFAIQLK